VETSNFPILTGKRGEGVFNQPTERVNPTQATVLNWFGKRPGMTKNSTLGGFTAKRVHPSEQIPRRQKGK